MKLLDSLQGGGMMLQTSSDINMDPDAEKALEILSERFPDDFP